MILLKQFKQIGSEDPDPSLFCAKVESFLKYNKIDYKQVPGNIQKSPKGKFPSIEIDGKEISDSEFILESLGKKFNIDMDAHLSAEERAISYSMKKLIEEYIYFTIIHFRWGDLKYWPKTKELFFANRPFLFRTFIAPMVQKKIARDIRGQGMGLHTSEEVARLAGKSLQALSDFLGDKTHMMGNKVSTLDIVAFSMLWGVLKIPLESPIQTLVQNNQKLVGYMERMHQEIWLGKTL